MFYVHTNSGLARAEAGEEFRSVAGPGNELVEPVFCSALLARSFPQEFKKLRSVKKIRGSAFLKNNLLGGRILICPLE